MRRGKGDRLRMIGEPAGAYASLGFRLGVGRRCARGPHEKYNGRDEESLEKWPERVPPSCDLEGRTRASPPERSAVVLSDFLTAALRSRSIPRLSFALQSVPDYRKQRAKTTDSDSLPERAAISLNHGAAGVTAGSSSTPPWKIGGGLWGNGGSAARIDLRALLRKCRGIP